jgi:aminoglycoside phosphotransferase family enzyme
MARHSNRNNLMNEDDKVSTGQRGVASRRITLGEKVAFLSRPDIYPNHPTAVEVVETHMSWVFLTLSLAHKLKKPVHYDFLDFRTLESRRRNCHAEVRLNRRLAPDIYIGAVPLTLEPSGHLRLDGDGMPIDWLVRMRRLPADRLLDGAIAGNTVGADDLERVARLLASFYRDAKRPRIAPAEFLKGLTAAIAKNRQELVAPEFDLPAARVNAISDALDTILAREAPLFERRIHDGCVVEGHGDLKPEHVYLGPEPAVIDCLEFNRDFRILDWVDELAYLAVECERLGSRETGEEIMAICCRLLDDAPPAALIAFYKIHRALLRARLAIAHLRDDDVREPGKWRPRALEYLSLAEGYLSLKR